PRGACGAGCAVRPGRAGGAGWPCRAAGPVDTDDAVVVGVGCDGQPVAPLDLRELRRHQNDRLRKPLESTQSALKTPGSLVGKAGIRMLAVPVAIRTMSPVDWSRMSPPPVVSSVIWPPELLARSTPFPEG